MDKEILHATRRTETGRKVGTLRRNGFLPAVMYGRHFETTPVTLDLRDTTKHLSKLTSSSLVTIELDGKENAALVRERQRDFIKGTLLHIDFQVVSLTEKIRANVGVELTGTSPAVKDFNGVIVTGIDRLEVECLPQYLPERFIVDISKLTKIGESIYVRDLVVSEHVVIHGHSDDMLVTVSATQEEATAETVVVATEEPEMIEKGKKEDEEEENKEAKK
jgi:large subunit ribosomal protein L25